jgi:hypothetical protein
MTEPEPKERICVAQPCWPPVLPSIVLVEDDGPLRTLTARALREHGYEVPGGHRRGNVGAAR